MPFWQFYQKSADWLDWPALLVQPSISAHRKWPEMVVSASTNQVWTKITVRSYAWSFAIQIQIQAEIHCYLSVLKSWHNNPFLSGVNCFHITSYLKADLFKSVHISKKNNNFILTYDLLDRTHAQCACGIFWICLIKSLIPLCAHIALYWMPNLKFKSRVDIIGT